MNLNETIPTPFDSTKKKKRGRKYLAGGLAEEFARLIHREKSDITFWEHKVKTSKENDVIGEFIVGISILCMQ